MPKKLFTPEETSKKFASLPKAIQDLLYSFEMTSIITKVGEKNSLHIDQMDRLNTETAQVMLGLTETKDFPEVIMEDLEIDRAKADAVAQDINDMLFIKIRDAMKQGTIAGQASTPQTLAPLSSVIPINKTPEPAPVVVPAAPTASLIPAKATEIHPADMMLTQKTVTTTATPTSPAQKVEPPKPGEYKADPYREPTI